MTPPRRHLITLAWRWLLRERRQGELTLIFLATLLAAAVAALTGRFAAHINQHLLNQGVDILGADLIVSSPTPLPTDWLQQARTDGLQISPSAEFASVVVHGDRLQLCSIKAAAANYPLRGEIRIADRPYGEAQRAAGMPGHGEIWAESRLFDLLGVRIGDQIRIGAASFTLTRALRFEPSRGGNFINLSPHILMRWDDLPGTQLIQPGSRVRYRTGLSGPPRAIQRFQAWLTPQIQPNQRLLDVHSGRPATSRALDRIEQYLHLGGASALLLAGIAIAVTARRYASRHIISSALLRTFGVVGQDIVRLFFLQLLLLGTLASALGSLAGWLAGQGLITLILSDATPAPFLFLDRNLIVAFLTGLLTLLGFGIAPILAIQSVPAIQVLRRLRTRLSVSHWLTYLLAGVTLFLLMLYHTGSVKLILQFVLGAGLLIVLAGTLFFGLLHILRYRIRLPYVWWRYGVINLWRQRGYAIGQAIAFGLIFMCFALLVSVRQELFFQWRSQLPPGTPNTFAINIQPQDVSGFSSALDHIGIAAQQIYPLVRGRLIKRNGLPIQEAVNHDAEDNNALHRDLNLTWSRNLPEGNSLVSGQWWQASRSGIPAVSVEIKLAQQLGIQPGDTLTFQIGSDEIQARVSNLRSVEWESFRPNFFFIFPPGVLNQFASTYMTSFHISDAQRAQLPALLREFPSVTLLDVDYLLGEVRHLFDQGSRAISALLTLILLAGTLLLIATVIASSDYRIQQGALLRALGANTRQLRLSQTTEFLTLGLLAGLLAWCGTELARYGLSSRVFDLPYAPDWQLLIGICLAAMTGLGVLGNWATRSILRQSPLVLLRETQD